MEVTAPPGGREHSSDPSEQHSAGTADREQPRGDTVLIGGSVSTASSTATSTTEPEPNPEAVRLRAELAHVRLTAHTILDAWEASEREAERPPPAIQALRHELAREPDHKVLRELVYGYGNVTGLIGGLSMESYPPQARMERLEAAERAKAQALLDALGVPRPKPRRST